MKMKMMTEFLIRHFIKDYKDVEKISVRTAYGVLASIVGIFCNVLLFVVKFVVGLVLHSVSSLLMRLITCRMPARPSSVSWG